MLAKIFLVASLATVVVSFPANDEDELINAVLGSGTTLMKQLSKLITDDDKLSVDLNSLYKKYEIASKAGDAKNYLQIQYKRGTEMMNEFIKKSDIENENSMKESIESIKREDPVLGEKLMKYYDKQCDINRIKEDIIKYVFDAEMVGKSLEKVRSVLGPLEHKLAEAIKKLEIFIIEHLPKKGKGKK